jgi:cell division septal protein FtsQ
VKAASRSGQRSLPRRRKPSLVARVRPFWILLLVVAALLAWGGIWLAHAPWFRVARVTIDVPAASPVSRDQVSSTAAISPDANIWLLDPGAIARRIEAIPYVYRATIGRRQFPRPALEIAIGVRRPSACVRAGGQDVTIDATARVVQTGCAAPALPWIEAGNATVPAPGASIVDGEIARLLADARVLADANLAIRRVSLDRWGGLDAVDVTGLTLEFGDDTDELAWKASLVQPVRNGIGTKRPVRAIDLRSPKTPTVEFR